MFYKQNLFEYDIRQCNINVCVTFNLISDEFYNKLNNMEKQDREVAFGLFLKEHKEIYPKFKQAVSRCVERFKKINDLSDKDILNMDFSNVKTIQEREKKRSKDFLEKALNLKLKN